MNALIAKCLRLWNMLRMLCAVLFAMTTFAVAYKITCCYIHIVWEIYALTFMHAVIYYGPPERHRKRAHDILPSARGQMLSSDSLVSPPEESDAYPDANKHNTMGS